MALLYCAGSAIYQQFLDRPVLYHVMLCVQRHLSTILRMTYIFNQCKLALYNFKVMKMLGVLTTNAYKTRIFYYVD